MIAASTASVASAFGSGEGESGHLHDGSVPLTPEPPQSDRLFPAGKIVHLYRLQQTSIESARLKPGSPQYMRKYSTGPRPILGRYYPGQYSTRT